MCLVVPNRLTRVKTWLSRTGLALFQVFLRRGYRAGRRDECTHCEGACRQEGQVHRGASGFSARQRRFKCARRRPEKRHGGIGPYLPSRYRLREEADRLLKQIGPDPNLYEATLQRADALEVWGDLYDASYCSASGAFS